MVAMGYEMIVTLKSRYKTSLIFISVFHSEWGWDDPYPYGCSKANMNDVFHGTFEGLLKTVKWSL